MKNLFVQYIWKLLGINRVLYRQEELLKKTDFLEKNQKELLKAIMFNNTIRDCEWLKYKSFSAGGWAVDYGCLYTLFRVLNDIKPKKILEFGLGQSSKLIHQYADFYSDVQAVTYEHDENWIDFFEKGKIGNYPVNIRKTDLEQVEYKGVKTLSYKNNCDEIKDQKFDLIMIDAPFGSERYSRSQILNIIPKCLCGDFCIILDDYERTGEQETIEELKQILQENNISFKTRTYSASKSHIIICSEGYSFLTTISVW